MKNRTLTLKILIKSQPRLIWKVLTNKIEFSKCFNGLEISCNNWRIDGVILFNILAVNENDRAIITNIDVNKTLSYRYYKSNSEDFINVIFNIMQTDNENSEIFLSGNNFRNQEEYQHTNNAWNGMLERLKFFLEQKKTV